MRVKITVVLALLLASAGLLLSCSHDSATTEEKALVEGMPAPDFTLQDANGQTWNLSSLKGSVVVVNFWATWCAPCIMEMPSISNLQKRTAHSKTFALLPILYRDSPDNAKNYFAKEKYAMPILLDPDSKTAKAYGITGVPETFIIDKKGILRKKIVGPFEFNSNEAVQYFNSLIIE